MSKSPRGAQGGFTLIELVVVIVILGILAAFAIPRFAKMDGSARAATVRALEGSLRSSSTMAHGMWLAAGNSPGTVAMEGGVNVAMNAAGFPTAANGGIRATLDPNSYTTTTARAPGRFITSITGTTMDFRAAGAPNNSDRCLVRYTPPAAANGLATIVSDIREC